MIESKNPKLTHQEQAKLSRMEGILWKEFEHGIRLAMLGRYTLDRGYTWDDLLSLCREVFAKAVRKGKGKNGKLYCYLENAKGEKVMYPKNWGKGVAEHIWRYVLGDFKPFPKLDLEDLLFELKVDFRDYFDAEHFRALGGERFEFPIPSPESRREIMINLSADAIALAEYYYTRLRYRKDNSKGVKRSGLEDAEIFEWMRRQELLKKGRKLNKKLLLLYLFWASVGDDRFFVYLSRLFAGYAFFPSNDELDQIRRRVLMTEWKLLSLEESRLIKKRYMQRTFTRTPVVDVVGIKENKAIVAEMISDSMGKHQFVKKEVPIDTNSLWHDIIDPGYEQDPIEFRQEKRLTYNEIAELTGLHKDSVCKIVNAELAFRKRIKKEEEEYIKLFDTSVDVPIKDYWIDTKTGEEVETELDDQTGNIIVKKTGEIAVYGSQAITRSTTTKRIRNHSNPDEVITIHEPKDVEIIWGQCNPRYQHQMRITDDKFEDKLIAHGNACREFWKKSGMGYLARNLLTLLLYQTEYYFSSGKLWFLKKYAMDFIKPYLTSGQKFLLLDIAQEFMKKALEDTVHRDNSDKKAQAEKDSFEAQKKEAEKLAAEEGISIEEAERRIGVLREDQDSIRYLLVKKQVKRKNDTG